MLRNLRYQSDRPRSTSSENGMSPRYSVDAAHSRNSSAPFLPISSSGAMYLIFLPCRRASSIALLE